MPSKLYADETDAFLGIKDNARAPGKTNTNSDATGVTMSINDNSQYLGKTNAQEVKSDQYSAAPAQIDISP